MNPVAAMPGGVRIRVRVQPRASRTELAGRHGDALRIRLSAPPVDGAANECLERFLSGLLGVPRSSVRVVAGAASRSKVVEVAGPSIAGAEAKLGLYDGGRDR